MPMGVADADRLPAGKCSMKINKFGTFIVAAAILGFLTVRPKPTHHQHPSSRWNKRIVRTGYTPKQQRFCW